MSRSNQNIIRNTLPLDSKVMVGHNQLIADMDAMAAIMNGSNVITATVLSTGSTTTQIATTATDYRCSGVPAHKAAVAAGTAITAVTVPSGTWALFRVTINLTGTITVTGAAGNATGYATEALAIAALPAVPNVDADLGYFTVLTKVGSAWVAATDSLLGGVTGNPASATNFYPTVPAWSNAALVQTAPVLVG